MEEARGKEGVTWEARHGVLHILKLRFENPRRQDRYCEYDGGDSRTAGRQTRSDEGYTRSRRNYSRLDLAKEFG